MFGEYDSESPRVPSPWDSLMSSPLSRSPSRQVGRSDNILTTAALSGPASPLRISPSPILLPRLVPENDSGNVEYKLQLLSPSPARFARLVTQLKWRLLEGGGQAYYELGVADSGDLVGLGRNELESSLDTLEMMAGEIGASVIVVKEIEVPAELAARYEEDAKNSGNINSWGDARGKRSTRREKAMMMFNIDDDNDSTTSAVSSSPTINTEGSGDTDEDDLQNTEIPVALQRAGFNYPSTFDNPDSMAIFSMDLEIGSGATQAANIPELDNDKLALPPSQAQWTIDLEISSVYKPRPMSKRFHHILPAHQYHRGGYSRLVGKGVSKNKSKQLSHHKSRAQNGTPTSVDEVSSTSVNNNKAETRRQARDRRREERKQALALEVVQPTSRATTHGEDDIVPLGTAESSSATDALVEQLGSLHVDVETNASASNPKTTDIAMPVSARVSTLVIDATVAVDAAGVNCSNHHVNAKVPGTDQNKEDMDDLEMFAPVASTYESAEVGDKPETRLIVEVLVVRKMSIEEGFLDFEGFSFL